MPIECAGRGGGDRRLQRVQERHRRGAAQGPSGHGPLCASRPWLPANSMSAAASNERSQGAQAARTTRSRRPGVRCAPAAQAERLAGLFVAGVCGRRDGVITENDAILSGDVHDGVAGFLVLPCVALEPVIQLGGPAVEAGRDLLAPEAPRRSRFVVEADSGSEGRGTVP